MNNTRAGQVPENLDFCFPFVLNLILSYSVFVCIQMPVPV